MSERTPVSKRLRFEVFKRDLFTCQYCGSRPPTVVLEVDHVLPVCEGGKSSTDNLTTACVSCNRGKAGVSLGDVSPALDEMQYLAAIQEMGERRAMLRGLAESIKAHAEVESEAIGLVIGWWCEEFGDDEMVEIGSIRRFIASLPIDRLHEAVMSASAFADHGYKSQRQVWKYFCGTCWRMIRADSEAE